jgi:hypothetical protein
MGPTSPTSVTTGPPAPSSPGPGHHPRIVVVNELAEFHRPTCHREIGSQSGAPPLRLRTERAHKNAIFGWRHQMCECPSCNDVHQPAGNPNDGSIARGLEPLPMKRTCRMPDPAPARVSE